MKNDESAALGAAILGGAAGGIYKSVQECCERCVSVKSKTMPDADSHEKYMKLYGIYKQLYPAIKDSYRDLALI